LFAPTATRLCEVLVFLATKEYHHERSTCRSHRCSHRCLLSRNLPVITEKAALDACARAFATSLAAPGAAAPTFRLVDGSPHNTGSVSEYFAREYTFELHADSQKTGLPIARASCSTDARGAVIALSPIPMETVRATLATR